MTTSALVAQTAGATREAVQAGSTSCLSRFLYNVNMASKQAVFTIRQLCKTYHVGDIDIHALRGVDLDLYPGEFVVMLGASGSGKSTLLNILGGLDTASSGTVLFRDLDLTHASDQALTRFRRQHVGFVFQFYNLIPSLTASENVAIVTEIASHPMPPEQALEMVGLAQRLQHFPAQLSGGEQQRVAIARAVAKRPEVLLCDEPTGALDSKTGIVVLRALLQANEQLGTTTIIITHNAAIAAMADRVILLSDGSISNITSNPVRAAPESLHW